MSKYVILRSVLYDLCKPVLADSPGNVRDERPL